MKDNLEAALGVIGLIILAILLLGYPVMLLWNWLMPTIFNLPYISFWQALGLNTLCTILFKSSSTTNKS
jgi:hypothetical protein